MNHSFLRTARILLVLIVLVSGCVGSAPAAQKEQQATAQEILISGSGTGSEILKHLADTFSKENPGVTVRFLPPTSTGDGVIGAGDGTLDIGATAREMKDSEKAKYPNLAENIFVRDAMILAVNPRLNVTGLTSDQIRNIHAGNITNWLNAGGPDAAIVLLDREESESSKQVLRKWIIGSMNVTPEAVMLYSANATNDAIVSNEFAMGQMSLGAIKMSGLKIKPLAIDGVMPSPDTVKSGEYKMVREYGIVYKREGASSATKKFVDFIFSDEATRLLAKYDFVPTSRG